MDPQEITITLKHIRVHEPHKITHTMHTNPPTTDRNKHHKNTNAQSKHAKTKQNLRIHTKVTGTRQKNNNRTPDMRIHANVQHTKHLHNTINHTTHNYQPNTSNQKTNTPTYMICFVWRWQFVRCCVLVFVEFIIMCWTCLICRFVVLWLRFVCLTERQTTHT